MSTSRKGAVDTSEDNCLEGTFLGLLDGLVDVPALTFVRRTDLCRRLLFFRDAISAYA